MIITKLIDLNISVDNIKTSILDIESEIATLASQISDSLDFPPVNITLPITLEGDNELAQSFYDKMVQSGSDLVLLADQADQFICASNDAFERVADVYIQMSKGGISQVFKDVLNSILEQYKILKSYLENRVYKISSIEILTTKGNADKYYNDVEQTVLEINDLTIDQDNIINKSLGVIEVIQNSLLVNSTIGITLSVTNRAWYTLEKLSQLPYTTSYEKMPELIELSSNSDFYGDALSPKNIEDLSPKFFEMYPKVFLEEGEYFSDNYKFVITHEELDEDLFILDNKYEVKSISDLSTYLSDDPTELFDIFNYIAFMEVFDFSINTLESWYDNQLDKSLSLNDFKAFFIGEYFNSLINKFNDGIHSTIIDEYYVNYQKNANIDNFSQILKSKNINETIQPLELFFIDEKIFKGTDENFHPVINDYVSSSYNALYNTNDIFNRSNNLVEEYKINVINNPIKQENVKRRISIKQYKEDILIRVVESIYCNMRIFKRNYTVLYSDGKINNLTYKYDKDILTLYYNIERSYFNTSYTFHENRFLLNTYLIINQNGELLTHDEESVFEKTDVITNETTTDTVTYANQYDEVDQTYNFNKKIITETLIIEYVTSKQHVRKAVAAANSYRKEYLAERLTYGDARIYAITATIRSLGYQQILEDYLRFASALKIPKY